MAHVDMFLKVQTARQGVIKGESKDLTHGQEIDVINWSWGLRAHTDMSGIGASAKADIDELEIIKHVDSASTALMAAVRNNDPIKTATLTIRKAGGGKALEYVKITVEDARVTLLHVESEEEALIERLKIAFKKVSVEYVPQAADGSAMGSMSFETEIGSDS
jgi:type VI secretion system secreted protein Hcp